MQKLHVAFIALFALACAVYAQAGMMTTAPEVVINLDLPPAERYTPLGKHFSKKDYDPILAYINHMIPEKFQPLIPILAEGLEQFVPAEFAGEIQGISKTFGVDLHQVVILNLMYEVSAYCTSIVARHENGTVFHGRNLDYGIKGLRNLTVVLDFQRNNQTVYKTVTFAGYVGAMTGMKPGVFSVSLDERDQGSLWENLFEGIFRGAVPVGMFIRQTLDTATSYEEAFGAFQRQHFFAPAYLIMAGAKMNEGAIITRDRESPADVWVLGADRWFLVETNYDHWGPVPKDDNRRDPANNNMKKHSPKEMSTKTIMETLSISPVMNDETKYTALMCPATGEFRAFVRYDAV